MPRDEATISELAGVPTHYGRFDPPFDYGSKGKARSFKCRDVLKQTLNDCCTELFDVWGKGKPSIILSAGTLGDGENAHGKGYAFDLDGFFWGDERFMMDEYAKDRRFYNGINAQLFLYFPQVLSFHYPRHHDHFHMDFNSSKRFRSASNAQMFFVQSALVYIYEQNIGKTGNDGDGVDGIYGDDTKKGITAALKDTGLWGQGGLSKPEVWAKFLTMTRDLAFG
ncbi:hypothetical protein [Shimia sp. Alg240-R146]|uniref:hypothetical protein n=1 Tax=Shimia sp. Alg240-R146 TaxID=2993449 RepID=UPI0022E4DC32|nr:hypothetical protein [Shimia sp. Alg240-R146]